MNVINHNLPKAEAFKMIRQAAETGIFTGDGMNTYLNSCRWFLPHYDCIIVFTRDTGYHSGGWWKNPEYERCYHLSISFPGGRNRKALNEVLAGLFGWQRKLLWAEPPYSKEGRENEVWHYRLFCDQGWQPIKPRGGGLFKAVYRNRVEVIQRITLQKIIS
ncbi:hypothetical protein [Anaerophaga thermohalophila]|uniref:hypothetical protein n=1 Tax=Anaerophaga thermohalophila TaxID=177400 RepID=UPI000237C823|nr:hypothetical protein [Anaerophaga thermohalophila]